MARTRRCDRRHQLVPGLAKRPVDGGVARARALQLLEHVQPRAPERRLPAARAPPDPQLPQVRASRGAGADDVGLAVARPAPRAPDAAARLDVLTAGGAALRDGALARRRGGA